MTITLYESNLTGSSYILPFLSSLAVIFAIYIIISKNPIWSVLFLIGLFCCISLYLMLIGLQFLGLVYLIVYVGAVSILFLFILMLINIRVSELMSDNSNSVFLAILAIVYFSYSVYDTYDIKVLYNYVTNFTSIQDLGNINDGSSITMYYLLYKDIMKVSDKQWDAMLVVASHITSIGNILYTNLLILFIVTSLILLLAMVGAIIITIGKPAVSNEWSLTPSSKPHSFVNLPLQSSLFYINLYKLKNNGGTPWRYDTFCFSNKNF